METKIKEILAEIQAYEINNAEQADQFRMTYLVRKGLINSLFADFKALAGPEKAKVGKPLNQLKNAAQEKFDNWKTHAAGTQTAVDQPDDLTLPGDPWRLGSRHPLSLVQNKIIRIFEKLNFRIANGPEIEDDWHNFTALNFPPDHPARDMQDTFFLSEDRNWALRTHTSNVQIRVMENEKPPIRVLAPGRVYRNEAVSARAHCFFHQVEGLYIDEGVSFPNMTQDLDYFAKQMFGPDTQIKLRPSYFPFTEISAEMDVSCMICEGEGCPVCKYTGWVEIMGCGMVDPNVLENCNIDPDKYSGYAFGMGVERIAQLLFRVPDLRLYSQNDMRFLNQFRKITL